ncbi:hypothetical protein [Streptomyces sp. A1547]|uniref:hypothetical protein n=1 Tax=Streptomyces sp. A1547 TaxID=2563105 RepID=UPI00144A71AF|nr:hypothetical protein [Streptomyces sp. A1547]
MVGFAARDEVDVEVADVEGADAVGPECENVAGEETAARRDGDGGGGRGRFREEDGQPVRDPR